MNYSARGRFNGYRQRKTQRQPKEYRELHNLIIIYTVKNIFTGKIETRRENLRLNWEGVCKSIADPYYKEHNASFELHPYWGQPTDN